MGKVGAPRTQLHVTRTSGMAKKGHQEHRFRDVREGKERAPRTLVIWTSGRAMKGH